MISYILDLYAEEKIQFKNIIEFSLLITGRKSSVRLVGKVDLYNEINAKIQIFGFFCEKSDFMLKNIKKSCTGDYFHEYVAYDNSHDANIVIYIGRNGMALEAKSAEAHGVDDAGIANIYGYPACCASKYQDIIKEESWINCFIKSQKKIDYSYLANKISYLIPPYLSLHKDYFPCGIECAQSMHDCAEAELALEEVGLGYLLVPIKKHLCGLCLIVEKNLYFFWSFSRVKNGFNNLQEGWHMSIGTNPGKRKRYHAVQLNNQEVILCSKGGKVESFLNAENQSYFAVFSE